MEIKIENNLSANEYNNLRSRIGWDTKDIEVVQNAIKNSIIIKKATFKNKSKIEKIAKSFYIELKEELAR